MRFLFFAGDVGLATCAAEAGADRIVVDMERRRKRARQHGYHLECSGETLEDLRRTRRAVKTEILCRINPPHPGTAREVESVLRAGADVIMLPMFTRRDQVERFLDAVGGRARTSLLFETRGAVELAAELASAGFDEAYVGLNDLALSYEAPFCYQLVCDGVVEHLRQRLAGRPFGFGGVTVADGGTPLPTRLIAAEQARLGCTDVILRRAFKRDVRGRDVRVEIERLRALYAVNGRRTQSQVDADRRRFLEAVGEVVVGTAVGMSA